MNSASEASNETCFKSLYTNLYLEEYSLPFYSPHAPVLYGMTLPPSRTSRPKSSHKGPFHFPLKLPSSPPAFLYIKLRDFDSICNDKRYTGKWQALMMLMQRDWFSRRWIVQEITLASKARIYCGPDSLPWKKFAGAVELFAEVETTTHRLSEVMQKNENITYQAGSSTFRRLGKPFGTSNG
jgi:hypothetical protein